jgi:hypothetical protein
MAGRYLSGRKVEKRMSPIKNFANEADNKALNPEKRKEPEA